MHANQRVEEDNRDPVSALFDSLKETERQQAFLRQQLKAALQDKMRAATAKIQAAQKEQSDLETVWKELFGEEECVLDDEVQAPTVVPPVVVEEDVVQEEDRKKVEASTWRWFEGAVEGDEGVSRTLKGGLPNESSHLLPSYKSTPPVETQPPVKMTRFMEEAEPIDQESDSRLALSTSLSASLGSLASSAAINTVQLPASHYDSILKSSYREPPYRMVASERVGAPTGLVAVRRESLITLLRAFDQILLHEAA